MIKRIEVTPDITLVERTGIDGRLVIEGYTEILDAFRKFCEKHPEASKLEEEFDPTPWCRVGARPFIHVKNEELETLFIHWENQLVWILSKREPPTNA